MKITKIEIKNFRGIINFSTDNILGDYLTVLDGENGFGKTTIFDAIEFCITGWVKRLSYGSSDNLPANPPKTVLKHKEHIVEKASVSLIFNNEYAITREIGADIPGLMNENEKGKYPLIEGEDILQSLNITTENYKNIFYIPQTDSTELIAGTGKDIKSFLDKLFNTENEVSFRETYLNHKNSINNKVESIIKQLENNIANYRKEFDENKIKQEKDCKNIDTVSFIETDVLINFFWYKNRENKYSKVDFSEEVDSGYLARWKTLLYLYNESKNAWGMYTNSNIQNTKKILEENTESLKKYINYNNSVSKINHDETFYLSEKIKSLYEYSTNLGLLEKGNSTILLEKKILFPNISKYNDLGIYGELVELERKFGEAKELLNRKGSTEKIYNDVFATLVGFWDKYQFKNNNEIIITSNNDKKEDDTCPLCTTKNVNSKILEQIKFLKQKAGIEGNESERTWSLLYSSELQKKLQSLHGVLNKKQLYIGELQSFFDGREYKIFVGLCKDLNIEVTQLDLDVVISDDQIAENTNNIKQLLVLLDKGKSILDEKYDINSYKIYQTKFTELFGENYNKESKERFIDILNKDIILNNIRYFENERNKLLNEELVLLRGRNIEITKNIDFCNCRVQFLTDTLQILGSYKDKLETKIKDYKKKKIKNISLPVYIFSQRIVKNYNGLGIYLKEDAIQLIEKDGKHSNPLFSLSSGQAEGLILAVMLANNINQGFSKFASIMIDDPIQSLDDLNILSFVNLLRYQFPERQIIISTHDDDFSELIQYKFWRLYGKESYKNINMKDRFLIS